MLVFTIVLVKGKLRLILIHDQVTHYPLQSPASGGALSIALGVQHLDSTHRADPLLVGAGLAIVRPHLVHFLLK